MLRLITLLVLASTLPGCAWWFDPDAEGGPGADPGTDEAPDFVILAVSGHCLTNCPGLPTEYLVANGAAQVFANALAERGLSSVTLHYADALYNRTADGTLVEPFSDLAVTQYGFLQLVVDLDDIAGRWMTGEAPTRLLVIAHSHGVVWAHTALLVREDVPVFALVDLDGDSTGWAGEGDVALDGDGWQQQLDAYTEATGIDWGFDVASPEDSWEIPGLGSLQDVEDVVPPRVEWNLEVRGDDFPLADLDPNHRGDGSTEGVLSTETNEGHERLADPDSGSVRWAVDRLVEALGG